MRVLRRNLRAAVSPIGATRRIATLAPLAACLAWLGGCGASLNNDLAASLVAKPTEKGAQMSTAADFSEAAGATARPQLAKSVETLTATTKAGSSAYRIGPLDVLDVSVFQVPDLSKTVQVADTGTVNLPLVGNLPAAGRTAQEVERDLTAKLGAKYLQNPQVTVFVKEFNSQRVTIEGAVKKPGVYPVTGRETLMHYIAKAEGLEQTSDTTVLVIRQANGMRSAARFDLAQIRAGAAADPPIESGDVIVVNTSTLKEAFSNLIKVLPLANTFALIL